MAGLDPGRRAVGLLDDAALAQLSAAGRRDAFGELARRHGSAVRALLRRMGADPATADDIAQDAFIAALERIGDLRDPGAAVGWLKRIAARLYLRRLKSRLRLETPLDDADEPATAGEGDAAGRIDLDRALMLLTPSERLCVSLCHGAGFSHAEVAETLNAPLGTVKSHVKRGLDKLKILLAPSQAAAG